MKKRDEFRTFVASLAVFVVIALGLFFAGIIPSRDIAGLATDVLAEKIVPSVSNEFDGYIVQLQEPAVLENAEVQELTQEIEQVVAETASSDIVGQATQLFDEAIELKSELADVVADAKYKIAEQKEDVIDAVIDAGAVTVASFDTAVNAIVVDATPEEIQQIARLPAVKKIWPNYKVQATLFDSVPLIGADKVWQLDVDGDLCTGDDVNGTNGSNSSPKKSCLTGSGVKIGIIDTGVDYTHPDLGGCLGGAVEAACDVDDVLEENTAIARDFDNVEYTIQNVGMSSETVQFELYIDGNSERETTEKLHVGDVHTLRNGATISPTEILYQSFEGGIHSVRFCLNAPKSGGAAGDLIGKPINYGSYDSESYGDCVSYADISAAQTAADITRNLERASQNICGGDDKQQFYDNLVSLATRRRDLLVDLIKTNPEAALRVGSLSQSLVDSLPAELVEKRGQFEGVLNVLHQDDFEHSKSKFLHYLQLNSFSGDLAGRPVNVLLDTKPIQLFSGTELPVMRSGATVSFSGLYVGNVAAVGGQVGVLSPPPGSPASENLGIQRTLALVVGIGSNPPPATVDQVRHTLFDNAENTAQKFHVESSYGQTQLQGDVVGPYQFDDSACFTDDVMDRALTEAKRTVDVTQYDRIIIAQPCTPCECYGGLGTLGKWQFYLRDGTPIRASVSWDFFWTNFIVDHELGHNFGVHHANKFTCVDRQGNPAYYSLSCNSQEYGDQFSVMGVGTLDSGEPEHHNAPHRSEMGWLSDDNVITTQNGEHLLTALELAPQSRTDVKMIRIPLAYETNYYLGVDDVYLTLELRQGRGVLVHYAALRDDGKFTYAQTNIARIDLSGRIYEKSNYILVPGKTFVDEFNGYEITVLELTGDTARVNIQQITPRVIDFSSMFVHYTFDDGTATDYGTDGLPGAMFGDIPLVAGALLFGGEQYIEVPQYTATAIGVQDQLTLSFWIYPHDAQRFQHVLFGSGFQLYAADNQLIIRLYLIDDNPNTNYFESSVDVGQKKWYHVMLTYDHNEASVYIDGVKVGSQSFFGKEIRMGFLRQYIAGNGDKGFQGIIDDFRLYSHGLSESEVQQLYAEFTPQPVPQCADGIDNDNDGRVDYSDDRGCDDYNDNDETNAQASGECKVIGGYDFVNNDNDPMDDHGHGTHVAATAAGKSLQSIISGQLSTFSFQIQNPLAGSGYDALYIKAQFAKGTAQIPYLMSTDGVVFSKFGDRILSSGKSNLVLSLENTIIVAAEQIFIASDSSSRESYPLVVNAVAGDSVTIEDEFAGAEYTLTVGQKLSIGNLELKLLDISGSEARLSIGSSGRFDVIYDKEGYEVSLIKTYFDLPSTTFLVHVKDQSGTITETHSFEWSNGVIDYSTDTNIHDITGTGLNGVAPDAKIVAYKVLNARGSGSMSHVIAAIERSVDPNQDGDSSDHLGVVSLSLGGFGDPDDPVSQAIDHAVDSGVVAVVAAGNDGEFGFNTIGSPGTARKAITVGATDKNKEIADFSSKGPVEWNDRSMSKPDITAPGVSICAAQWDHWHDDRLCIDDEHIAISGTSMATPHVSGVAALVKQAHPDWTPLEIKSALKSAAQDLGGSPSEQGSGFVDSFASVSLKNPPPVVHMEFIPRENGIFEVFGTATVRNFDRYTLFIQRKGEPAQEIFSSTSPVTNGVLGKIDTSLLPEGPMGVILSVIAQDGNSIKERGEIVVDNIQITEPLDHDIHGIHAPITITGRTVIPITYTIEVVPDGTSSRGEVIYNSKSTIDAQWIPPQLTQPEYYTFYVTINYPSGFTYTEIISTIYIDPTLKAGWPVRVPFYFQKLDSSMLVTSSRNIVSYDPPSNLQPPQIKVTQVQAEAGQVTSLSDGFYYFGGSIEPAVGDITGDGIEEVIILSAGRPVRLLIFSASGEKLNEIPLTMDGASGMPGGNMHYPVLADIDNDGVLDVVVYGHQLFVDEFGWIDEDKTHGRIFAINGNGDIIPGFPVIIPYDDQPTLIAADLNNDDNLDIIVKGTGGFNPEQELTIINSGGSIISHIPIGISHWGSMIAGSPAVGNFDSDSDLEIVVARPSENSGGIFDDNGFVGWNNEGIVRVFNGDGTLVSGWPRIINGIPLMQSPVVGDIDNDGFDDVIVGTFYAGEYDSTASGLYALSRNGDILSGWPFKQGNIVTSTPALSDIDGDGTLEIVVSTEERNENGFNGFYTQLVHHDGTIAVGWPVQVSYPDAYTSIVADINNDENLDIVAGTGNEVNAWNLDGSTIENFPKIGDGAWYSASLVSDFENDGILDLVWSGPWEFGRKLRGSIYVWELGQDSGNHPWPMFMHDPQHTGNFDGASCTKRPFYGDKDGDGFGLISDKIDSCKAPAGYVADSTDCNDDLASINPNAGEVCDDIDNNCNAQIDEGVKTTFYLDADFDAFGAGSPVVACSAPVELIFVNGQLRNRNYVTNNRDCADSDSLRNPGATEVCDFGVDNNCNGLIDEGNVCGPYTFQFPSKRVGRLNLQLYSDTATYTQWCRENNLNFHHIQAGNNNYIRTARYNPTTRRWVNQRSNPGIKPPFRIYCLP